MSLNFSKILLVTAGLCLILAIPLSLAIRQHTDALKIERAKNTENGLQIKSIQKQVQEIEQQVKDKNQENDQLKKDKEDLSKQLQAKAERKAEEDRVAQVKRTQEASVAVSANVGGCEQYRGLVSQYDWDVNTAMAVMRAESSCNPNAVNWGDNHGVCKGSFSLMQVGCFWYPHFGYAESDRYKPEVNVAVAYKIWQKSGFNPWTTYKRMSL